MKRTPTTVTEEERDQVITYFFALRKSIIQEFLEEQGLPKSGTKEELRARISDALDEGTFDYTALVAALDAVAPWGKQHVLLFDGPPDPGTGWTDPGWVHDRLRQHRLGGLFNAPLPLILPPTLRLSSIEHRLDRLRVTAVERRETWERDETLDERKETEEHEEVRLHAFVRVVTRGFIAFDWNLVANTAFLQVSQLPAHATYADAVARFTTLTRGWLPLDRFTPVPVSPTIKKLHELEPTAATEARSHNIDYRTLLGRRLAASSASAQDSVLGEAVIDEALANVREQAVGRIGNFYWLPGHGPAPAQNPLTEELHIVLVAEGHRTNFMVPSSEAVIRYVLQRVRTLRG